MKQLSLILFVAVALMSSCKTECPDPEPQVVVNPDLWNINDIKYSNGKFYADNVYQGDFSATTKNIKGKCEIRESGIFILDYKGTQVVSQEGTVQENPIEETIGASFYRNGNVFTIEGNSLYSGNWSIISETSKTFILSSPKILIGDDGMGAELRWEFDVILDLAK